MDKQCLDLDAHDAGGLFDRRQGRRLRDPQIVHVTGLEAGGAEPGLDLRAGAVHEHDPYPEAVQERDVMDERGEALALDRLAPEADHERPAAVAVHIGRDGPEPGDEGLGARGHA